METFHTVRREGFNHSSLKITKFKAFLNHKSTVKQLASFYELELPEMVDDEIVNVLSFNRHCFFDHRPCTVKDFSTVSLWSTSPCSIFNDYSNSKKRKRPLEVGFKGAGSGSSITLNLNAEESIFSVFPFEGVILGIQSLMLLLLKIFYCRSSNN